MSTLRGFRPVRAVVSAVTVTVASVVMSGCFTTTADFETDAERYIEDTVAEALEVEFVAVDCTAPVDQDVGTRFACTATEADGGLWEFDNVIDAPNEFTVNVSRRP